MRFPFLMLAWLTLIPCSLATETAGDSLVSQLEVAVENNTDARGMGNDTLAYYLR